MQIQGTVTIANGASLSDAEVCGQPLTSPAGAFYKVGSFYPVNITPDSAWDTQPLTFQKAGPDGVFANVFDIDTGAEYSITGAVASQPYPIKWQNFTGACYIKARSGTAASPQNQSGNTILTFTFNDFG